MTKMLKVIAVAALAVCGAAQAALVTTVDLFTTSQATLTDTTIDGIAVHSEVGGAADATILGGYRELLVETKNSLAPATLNASLGVQAGFLSFSTDSTAGGTGIVRWDGRSAAKNPLLDTAYSSALYGINTTGLGVGGIYLGNVFTDSFEILVIESDAGFNFRIEAYTDDNNWSTVEIQANAHPFSLPGTVTNIPLLAFLDCTNSVPPGPPSVTVTCAGGTNAVDFSKLGALQVIIDPAGTKTNLDLSLNQVTVVPEPGALALVGIALLGAGVASRRRKI